MASFDPIWNATVVFEGGFQQMAADAGNYCPAKGTAGSSLIGTNHGIAALTYAQYNGGRCPTVAQMKALTVQQAESIAKKGYWDKIQGDKIASQAVAHMIFDATWGSGSYGPYEAKQTINKILGANTTPETKTFTLTDKEIALINSIPEKQFFDMFTTVRQNFINGLGTYSQAWTDRLNKLVNTYSATLKNTVVAINKHIIPIMLLSIALATGIFLIIYNHNKK